MKTRVQMLTAKYYGGELSGPFAEWTDDCSGKKDYDGPLLSISTRYWPPSYAGSLLVMNVPGHPPDIVTPTNPAHGARAHAAVLFHGLSSKTKDDDVVSLSEKDFEAPTENEVKAQVEAWVHSEWQRIAELLQLR